jgi:signal transduction histidine kinase
VLKDLGITLEVKVNVPEDCLAFLDNKIYLSILYNLVDNAIRFNKRDGEISIKVKVQKSVQGDDPVHALKNLCLVT